MGTGASSSVGSGLGTRKVAVGERARPRERDAQPERAPGLRAHRSEGTRSSLESEQRGAPSARRTRKEGRNRRERQQLGRGREIPRDPPSSSHSHVDLGASTTLREGWASRDTERTITQENVELVRRRAEAFNRRELLPDFGSGDSAA
jgi:hypothetical protein